MSRDARQRTSRRAALTGDLVMCVAGQAAATDMCPVNELDPAEPAGLLDPLTGWYRRWYFLVQLDDALELAQLEESPLSLILLRLPFPLSNLPRVAILRLRQELMAAAYWTLRLNDIPGSLNDQELVVLLPRAGKARALRVMNQLRQRLLDFEPAAGFAVFPDDGWTAERLIAVARERADMGS